jgi:hypothetical protein
MLTRKQLANILRHCARTGNINLEAIETVADVKTAARFSSHFREAVRDIPETNVMDAIILARMDGKRTFRKGVGLWLTDAEMDE